MELIKRNIHMDSQRYRAATQITLEDDVNISDSRPDALKLIMDRGNVVIEEIKVTDDHVGVKGKLQFHILYLADGKEADVAGMDGDIPFEEQLYMEGITARDSISVEGETEDLSVGLINSRKFSVQSLLSLSAVSEELRDEETAVDIESSEPVEFRKKTLDIAATAVRKKDIFRAKQEVELPGSLPNICSMVWWETTPVGVDFKLLEDKIALQGEIRAFFLYRGEGEEEELIHYETTLPFAGSIECSGVREGMIPEIRYRAEKKEVEVRPDFDGEERVITFELCLSLDICAYEEERLEILSDVYGVVKEISVAEREALFRRVTGKSSGRLKLPFHLSAGEGAQIQKIIHTSAALQMEEAKRTENGIKALGTVNLQVLYESSKEAEKYGMIKESIPFSYMLEAEDMGKNAVFPLQAEVEQVSVSLIDTEEMDGKCVLFFKANIYEEWKERIVEGVESTELDNEKMAALPGIAVYVVREGESLWDIGKRYYVPVSVLRQTNELAGDEVKAGDRILIVKGL